VIDGMTLAEAGEIFAYWERDPPAHLMVQTIARLLGWTPRSSASGTVQVEEIAAAPPPGLTVARNQGIGMPAPLLDPDALRARNRERALDKAGRAQVFSPAVIPAKAGIREAGTNHLPSADDKC
jgi:hypothetical protein